MSITDETISGYEKRGSLLIFGAVAEDASAFWNRIQFNDEHRIPCPEPGTGLSFVLDTDSGELLVNKGDGETSYEKNGRRFILSSYGCKGSRSEEGASLSYDGALYELYRSRGLIFFIYSVEFASLIDAFSVDGDLCIRRDLSLSTLFLFQTFPEEEVVPYVKSLKDGDEYQRKVAYEICSRYHDRYPKLKPLLIKMLWSGIGAEPDKKRALYLHQCEDVPKDFRSLNLRYSVKSEVYRSQRIVVWANSESELVEILCICIQYGLHYDGFSSPHDSLKQAKVPAEWMDPGEIDGSCTMIHTGSALQKCVTLQFCIDPESNDSIFEVNRKYNNDQDRVLCDFIDGINYSLTSKDHVYYDTLKNNRKGQILGRTKLKTLESLSESYLRGKDLVKRFEGTGRHYIMQCWGGMGDDYRILGRLGSYSEAHNTIVCPIVTPGSKDFLSLYRYDGIVIEKSEKNDIMTYIRISQDYDAPLDLVVNDKHFDSIVTGKEYPFNFSISDDIFSSVLGIPPKTPFDRYHIPKADPALSDKVCGSILLVPHALFLQRAYDTERFHALLGKIVDFFSDKGFRVYTNTVGSQKPVPGTEPLCTTISEIVSVAHLFSHVISASTGLADVLINTPASISLLSISHPSLYKKDMAEFCHHKNYWGYVMDEQSDEEIIHGIHRAIQDQLPVVRDCHCKCGDKPLKEI